MNAWTSVLVAPGVSDCIIGLVVGLGLVLGYLLTLALYACPVWHYSLTKQQTKTVEDVQWRAVHIIAGNIPYADASQWENLPWLTDVCEYKICGNNIIQRYKNEIL